MGKIITMLIFVMLFYNASNAIRLDEALNSRLVTLEVKASSSTHYLLPLEISVRNIKNKPVEIDVPFGFIFAPIDTSYQKFVVNKAIAFTLPPALNKKVQISAMCINANKSSPVLGSVYKLAEPASGKLLEIVKYIEVNKYYSYAGQRAVWVVSDNHDLDFVDSFDDKEAISLQTFLSKLLSRPIPVRDKNDYSKNLKVRPSIKVMGGEFEFDFYKSRKVQIAMFDKNNIVVRELYNNPNEPAGNRKVTFEFDASVYIEPFYYFRLIADDEVLINRKISIH
jgi:hypothetical protein